MLTCSRFQAAKAGSQTQTGNHNDGTCRACRKSVSAEAPALADCRCRSAWSLMRVRSSFSTRSIAPASHSATASHSDAATTKPRRRNTRWLSVLQLYCFCASPCALLRGSRGAGHPLVYSKMVAFFVSRKASTQACLSSSASSVIWPGLLKQSSLLQLSAVQPETRNVPVVVQLHKLWEVVVHDLRHKHCAQTSHISTHQADTGWHRRCGQAHLRRQSRARCCALAWTAGWSPPAAKQTEVCSKTDCMWYPVEVCAATFKAA